MGPMCGHHCGYPVGRRSLLAPCRIECSVFLEGQCRPTMRWMLSSGRVPLAFAEGISGIGAPYYYIRNRLGAVPHVI